MNRQKGSRQTIRVCQLTNSPTPYRNHQFSRFNALFSTDVECSQEVWFTEWGDSHGRWRFESEDLPYPHRFCVPRKLKPGILSAILAALVVLTRLIIERPDVIIVGGYTNLALQATCVFARVLPMRFVLHVENHKPFNAASRVLDLLRTFLLRSFKVFIVPGALQALYVKQMCPHHVLIHRMPNVVDESEFAISVCKRRERKSELRREFGFTESEKLFLSVMRVDAVKGADGLAEAALTLPQNCRIIIAGTGPMKETIDCISRRSGGRLLMLGHMNKDRVLDLLAIADWFVLCSRNDPYPLSVIEATWAGLPLLLSDAVGCAPEALSEGVNGYMFQSGDIHSLSDVLGRAANVSSADLVLLGKQSSQIAKAQFSTEIQALRLKHFISVLSAQ